MTELLDVIKAIAKEGTDFTEIEGQIAGLNPMSGLKSKEDAWEMIKGNKLMLSAFDSEQSKRAETVLDNFKSGKMLDDWKVKETELRKTLNPEETESDKRLREMQEKIDGMESDKLLSSLKTDLSKKAKELEFDTIKAQDYAIYGDKAMEKLESDAEWFKTELETRLSSEIKDKYKGNRQPKSTKVSPADLDTQIREARAAGNGPLSLKLQLQKNQNPQT